MDLAWRQSECGPPQTIQTQTRRNCFEHHGLSHTCHILYDVCRSVNIEGNKTKYTIADKDPRHSISNIILSSSIWMTPTKSIHMRKLKSIIKNRHINNTQLKLLSREVISKDTNPQSDEESADLYAELKIGHKICCQHKPS